MSCTFIFKIKVLELPISLKSFLKNEKKLSVAVAYIGIYKGVFNFARGVVPPPPPSSTSLCSEGCKHKTF